MERIKEAKPYVVAEVGSNWLSFQDCLDSVVAAKQCGADAVKFQMFNWVDLYGYHPTEVVTRYRIWGKAHYRQPRSPLHGGIPKEWVVPLYEKCLMYGIDFMCTPFSLESAEFLNPYVKYHKVASSDLEWKELFVKLMEFRKPIMFSTGGHDLSHVQNVITLLGGTCPSIIMYCVSAYPANSVQLQNIPNLINTFKNPVGYSDHTTQIYDIPKRAQELGAIVIEKHFKLRDMETPDNPHSLNPHDFKLMVGNLKTTQPAKLNTFEERSMVLRHNRRLIALTDISPGERFMLGVNYGAYRSLIDEPSGLSAWVADDINGKICRNELKRGDHIMLSSLDI